MCLSVLCVQSNMFTMHQVFTKMHKSNEFQNQTAQVMLTFESHADKYLFVLQSILDMAPQLLLTFNILACDNLLLTTPRGSRGRLLWDFQWRKIGTFTQVCSWEHNTTTVHLTLLSRHERQFLRPDNTTKLQYIWLSPKHELKHFLLVASWTKNFTLINMKAWY